MRAAPRTVVVDEVESVDSNLFELIIISQQWPPCKGDVPGADPGHTKIVLRVRGTTMVWGSEEVSVAAELYGAGRSPR